MPALPARSEKRLKRLLVLNAEAVLARGRANWGRDFREPSCLLRRGQRLENQGSEEATVIRSVCGRDARVNRLALPTNRDHLPCIVEPRSKK